jgi:hypothetical protein
VTATLQSSSFNATHLRAFEFTLLETITFSTSPKARSGKKAVPQVKVNALGERKVPVNATMFGGMHHVAELGCIVPPDHPNATINSARHIDVAHKIVIKAVLDHMKPYILEVPVTLSNWQRCERLLPFDRHVLTTTVRHTSTDIVTRIGYAPNLSLGAPPAPGQLATNVIPANMSSPTSPKSLANTMPGRTSLLDGRGQEPMTLPTARSPNTVPSTDLSFARGVDEMGRQRPNANYQTATTPARRSMFEDTARKPEPNRPLSLIGQHFMNGGAPARANVLTAVPENVASGNAPGTNSEDSSSRPAGGASTARFTVMNVDHDNESDAGSTHQLNQTQTSQLPHSTGFPSAEMEKARLQERDQTQSSTPVTPPASTKWLSAEEEKRRIFERAQAAASQTQSRLSTLGESVRLLSAL